MSRAGGGGRGPGTRRGASAGSCPPTLAAAPGLLFTRGRGRPGGAGRRAGGRCGSPDLRAPLGAWPLPPGLCGVKLAAAEPRAGVKALSAGVTEHPGRIPVLHIPSASADELLLGVLTHV